MLPIADEAHDSPRDRIIRTLLHRGALTVTELTLELGVTATAIREQVNRLAAEGWLNRARRSQGPGRPAALFAVSEKTKRLFAGHGPDLSRLLVSEIAELDGEGKVQIILERVTRRMAEAARPAVGQGVLAERVRGLGTFLSHEGVLAESGAQPQGQRLAVFTCPYAGVVEEHRELCELERAAFSELTASPVRRQHCLLDGHAACEFTFSQDDGPEDGRPGPPGT
jgi:DeoR family transcriptional regulator, suf operon transcriptional repressor